MEVDRKHGFCSSFNFVPKGEYVVPPELRHNLERLGFEVGVHGFEHDGKLYRSKKRFSEKAAAIRECLREWNASGFRSPVMQHRLTWLHELQLEYDASTFDTDPFEPESDGVRTIFPFWVPGAGGQGYVELPYTLPQDFTLFAVLREPTIDIWKKKLDWVAAHGGMAVLNVHPDYVAFEGECGRDEYPLSHYEEFLNYLKAKYRGQYWSALPKDVSRFYRSSLPIELRNTRRKVGMVTHSVYESDNRVRRYAETLAKRGDLVDVFAISPRSGQVGTTNACGVTVHHLRRRKEDEESKWTYAFQLLRFLITSSVHLTRHHHRSRYDLVHIHNIPDFLVFGAWYPKWTGAKLILDIHDIVPELFQSKFPSRRNGGYTWALMLIEKVSAKFVDHVIVANHIWSNTLVRRSVPEEKCSVILNYVDPSIFYRRARTRSDERFIVVFPGSFQGHQGLDIGIRAFARVREQMPNAEFHLYGGGGGRNAQDELVNLANSLGLADSVRFFGLLTLDQVPQVMANADLGVVPKRADSFGNEACSTKSMEFMSQGVPVVGSRTKIDTIYFDDSTIRFFTSGDDEAMAEAMLDVIRHGDVRNRLISNGLEYVERYSWDRRKRDYLDLVDSLLTERFGSLELQREARRTRIQADVVAPKDAQGLDEFVLRCNSIIAAEKASKGSKESVCIIVENMTVPPDRRVWREARTLKEAGYAVSVICPKRRGFEASYEELEGIEVFRHAVWEGSSPIGWLLEYPVALVAEFWLALKVHKRNRFKVLQACNPPDNIFLIALFFKLFGVRFIFDQHDPVPEFFQARFKRKGFWYHVTRVAERLSFQTADVAIVTNDSCRELATTRGGVSPERCFIVRNCPSLQDFPLRPPLTELKAGKQHLVVYVGVMGSQDGIDLLLDSIDYLVNQKGRKDTLFVLIGGGSEVPETKARTTARGLDEWVRFTGPLYGEDLKAYLATGDVGVSPDPINLFNQKLTMIKILEYMACGLPSVLFDLAEGRRSAADSALYARGNDPIHFALHIATLLDSESLRRRLGDIGRKRIQEGLNWEIEKRTLLRAYEAALGARTHVAIGDSSAFERSGPSFEAVEVARRSTEEESGSRAGTTGARAMNK
jgi:glycosyltransferase involved in cell wall biosynthesis